MVNYTTVNISKKHSGMLNKIAIRNKRSKQAQLELMIEKESKS